MFQKLTSEQVLEALNITEPILNIYQYGSRVYGTNKPDADFDFIIVTKALKLASGAFRDNAISSKNRTYQGVLFSRSGFLAAIDNYEMNALECLFLPEQNIIQKTNDSFHIRKYIEKDMVNAVITKASNSFYIADNQAKDYDQRDRAKKGIFHALRILMFGLQLKEKQMIYDYQAANALHAEINAIEDEDFDTRPYMPVRDELIAKLRS